MNSETGQIAARFGLFRHLKEALLETKMATFRNVTLCAEEDGVYERCMRWISKEQKGRF